MHAAGVKVSYDRSPDFYRLLRLQGQKYCSALIRSQDDEPLTLFSFSFQKKWVGGELVDCGYAGDFRTAQSLLSARAWRKHFANIVRSVKDDPTYNRPKYILTAIMKDNVAAIRNIAAGSVKFGVRYDHLDDLEMVNVIGRLFKTKSKIKTVRATQTDEIELKSFIARSEAAKMFGAAYSENDKSGDEWNFKTSNWPNFSIEQFLIQRNPAAEIIACTLPFNPGFAKRMRLLEIPFFLKKISDLGSLLKIKTPKVGEAFETVYLTHLEINESKISFKESVSSFLNFLFDENPSDAQYSFAAAPGKFGGFTPFIKFSTMISLFCISLPEEPVVTKNAALSFEMGLV